MRKKIILTTGFEVQGYFITEYVDVIFDEMLCGIGFVKSITSTFDNIFSAFTGTEATTMIGKLNSVKSELRKRMITKAEDLGGDALIGIDFESSRLGDLLMVSMTATVVKLAKVVSPLPVTEESQRKMEAEEAERKKHEEKEQKIAQWKENGNDRKALLQEVKRELENMTSSFDMYKYISKIEEEHEGVFPEELLKELANSTGIERLYGRASGVNSFKRKMEAFYREFGIKE